MIATDNEFWQVEELKKEQQKQTISTFATVIEFTRDHNASIIQFDGESKPSQKTYRWLEPYDPVIGDKVQIIDDVIQGVMNRRKNN